MLFTTRIVINHNGNGTALHAPTTRDGQADSQNHLDHDNKGSQNTGKGEAGSEICQ